MAIFSRNSNQWKAKPLEEEDLQQFRRERKRIGMRPVLIHTSYLINLAAVTEELWRKSIDGMALELARADQLGVHAVVLHPGAHMKEGVAKGIDRVARALDLVHEMLPDGKAITLLETSAGQGSCLGCTFEELGQMIRLVSDRSRVGICFDTCHVFSAGYELRSREGYERTMDEMLEHVGLENVGAFHLNDSKRELGSRVDRHQHIGEGHLGVEPFAFLLNDQRFRGIPKMIETPKPTELDHDIENLRRLRALID